MTDPRKRCLAALVFVILIAAAPSALRADGEGPRASRPEASADWSTYGGDYANTRFSRLADINRGNVANLKVRWISHTGLGADTFVNFNTNPIVVGGKMYVTDPGNSLTFEQHVFALDAATGKKLWKRTLPQTNTPERLGFLPWRANRGAAVGSDKVYVATLDARLWALDAATGKPTKGFGDGDGPEGSVRVADIEAGYYLTMAPLFVPAGLVPPGGPASGHDLVIIGISGAENETRGFVTAYDAGTGKLLWRFFTVPAPDEFGGDTWPRGRGLFADPFQRGGGAVWMTPAYDPDAGLLIVPVGNAGPDLDGTHRAGANLFTASILALKIATGKRAWHFQEVHHDLWDYDQGSPPVLFDWKVKDRSVPAVGAAGKTGWFYVLDRRNGKPLIPCPERPVPTYTVIKAPDGTPERPFPTQPVCMSEAFVPQGGRTLPSGRYVSPIFTLPGAPGTQTGPYLGLPKLPGDAPVPQVPISDIIIEPGAAGGSEWSPVSFDPRLGLAFVAGNIGPMSYTSMPEKKPTPGRINAGGWWSFTPEDVAKDWSSVLSAMDVGSGKIRWRQRSDGLLVGGSCATQTGLVFSGELQMKPNAKLGFESYFSAFDARTGERLFRFRIPGDVGVNAPCVTFLAGGEQLVAVAIGGSFFPGRYHLKVIPTGDAVYVFGLRR